LRPGVFVKVAATVDECGTGEARVVPPYYSEHEYGVMLIQYVCVFDVKVNTRQVALPKNLATYSPEPREHFDGDLKWIKRDALISILRDLSGTKIGTSHEMRGVAHF
jgi:hypothetical protein